MSLGGELPGTLDALVATGKPVALVSLGNPYLLRGFPGVTAYLATFSTVPPSETAAVKALMGEIDIRGRLPVSIPGLANYGDGIQLPATHAPAPPPQAAAAPASGGSGASNEAAVSRQSRNVLFPAK